MEDIERSSSGHVGELWKEGRRDGWGGGNGGKAPKVAEERNEEKHRQARGQLFVLELKCEKRKVDLQVKLLGVDGGWWWFGGRKKEEGR